MKNDFYRLCDIIALLRAPGGCPWDREQTHQSLKKHLIEEAYEAADAIDSGDSAAIADELGDVLLQVVMHAQIGKEEKTFDIDTVTNDVCEKMITRHPHVFSNGSAKTPQQVLDKWEEIKRSERAQKRLSESMEGITPSLPALMRCDKIIKKALSEDFSCDALSSLLPDADNEIGEQLFRLCIKSHKIGVNPEEALSAYIKKFIKKIKNIEKNP